MHGWGGDSRTWQAWKNHFELHKWHWQSGERGYGKLSLSTPHWHSQSKGKRVVIGHSLGPYLLPKEVIYNATHFVFLASFSNFIPPNSNKRVLTNALKSMKSYLGTEEEDKMLKTFLSKVCHPGSTNELPPGPIQEGISSEGRRRLQRDLDLLINNKGLPAGITEKARVLVVEAQEDAIIVPEARKKLVEELLALLNKPPAIWSFPKTGHALLKTELIGQIEQWLELENNL